METVDYVCDAHLLDEIRCHPEDLFMGTVYMSAYTAHASKLRLKSTKPIVYFIQVGTNRGSNNIMEALYIKVQLYV